LKSPHLLKVEEAPEQFAGLIEAARALGLRVGWLDLATPAPPVDGLETAAALGVLRAVSVSGGRSVAVKPLRGQPVLRDLLREHFQGCVLVLVRGEVEAPRLIATPGGGWEVKPPETSEGAVRQFDSEGLAAALRKPRPWG
jgi:hypothetical protein